EESPLGTVAAVRDADRRGDPDDAADEARSSDRDSDTHSAHGVEVDGAQGAAHPGDAPIGAQRPDPDPGEPARDRDVELRLRQPGGLEVDLAERPVRPIPVAEPGPAGGLPVDADGWMVGEPVEDPAVRHAVDPAPAGGG